MSLHLFITAPWKRLRKAQPLPNVECTEREAREFFAGYWHGIALGTVIGAAAAVLIT